MALINQRNKRLFTFQSTPNTPDAQYFRREMEEILKYIDASIDGIADDSTDGDIIPTSQGGFGMDMSNIPQFAVPYAPQAGRFGWFTSSGWGISLLSKKTLAEWQSALGIVNSTLGAGTLLGRNSSSAGIPEQIAVGSGLSIIGNSLKTTGNLLALDQLTTNGLVVKTADNSLTTRALLPGDNVSITDGDGIASDPVISVPTVPSEDILVDRLAGSTYSTVQDFINTMHSPGTIVGGEITVISATQVRVAAGTGMIRSADDDVSSMPFFDWAQTDFTVPADDVIRYFGVVYNGGSPLVAMRTTEDWDKDREIPLGAALHISTNGILVLSNPYKTGDPITNIIQRFDATAPVLRDAYVGGLIIGTTGTRNIVISAGQLWRRLNDSAFAAFDSSAASRFTTVYYNPTTLSWVYTPSVAQWPNGQYNNTSSGTGLDAITGNRYVNLWFYIGASGQNVFMVYGQAQHVQLADAFAEGAPTFLPPGTAPFILLVGKLTFQNGAATPTQLLSPFTAASLGFGSVNTHNDLSGLQGGTTGEYYHLSQAAYNNISNGAAATPTFVGVTIGVPSNGVTRFGYESLASTTGAAQNLTAFGHRALNANDDTYNVAVGPFAGEVYTGHGSVFIGPGAGRTVTTGDDNGAFGADALHCTDASTTLTGLNNWAFGNHTGEHISSGSYNLMMGSYALFGSSASVLTGSGNHAFGYAALESIRGTSSENVANGYNAGRLFQSGDSNIFIGPYAGDSHVSGSLNILIGRDIQASATTASNELNIGNLITATGLTQGGASASGSVYVHGSLRSDGLGVGAAWDGVRMASIVGSSTTANILHVVASGASYAGTIVKIGAVAASPSGSLFGLFTGVNSDGTGGTLRLRVLADGGLESTGSVSTAAPSGSTARPWKFGDENAVSPTAPNRTVAIDVNGTVLYLHAKTTND